MALPPPPAPSAPLSGAGGFGVRGKEPEIVTIPDKFYGMALKMKAGEGAEPEKPVAPPPPPPRAVAPVTMAPAPKRSVLPVVLLVILLVALVGGGFVYFNRGLLFPKSPAPAPAPTPAPPAPPSAPANLSATASGQSIGLLWVDTSGSATGLRLERKEDDGTYLTLTNLSSGSVAFLDTSVQAGRTYTYRVIMTNAGGDSAPSNEATATLPAVVTPPTPVPAPTLLPSGLDSDSDGLTDTEETLYGTDPHLADTDRDSFLDGNEVFHLYNPSAKAPVRLLDSGLVAMFTAPAGWNLYAPADWTATLARPDGSQATIATGKGETFRVAIMDNPEHLSLSDWYLRAHPGTLSTDVKSLTTKGGLEGILGPDRLDAYFAWDGKVFSLRYDIDGQPFITFRTTYEMMLNSIKLVGAPVVSVSPDATEGPGTLVGAVTSTQP